MAFINPAMMQSMASNSGGINTGPSPGFFARMLGSMNGGQGGSPTPV